MFLRNLFGEAAAPGALADKDFDYITSASAAVLQQTPKGARTLMFVICGFVLCFIIWANVAQVDEFTRGEGKVIPSQQVQIVQNLEGGILAELFVQEGQFVERGQPLLRIDDKRFAGSLKEANITLKQLELKSARLRAEAEGQKFSSSDVAVWSADMFLREQSLYSSRLQELESEKHVLAQQVMQKGQEVSELKAKSDQLRRSVSLLEEELSRTREAAAGGAISEVELLRLERQVNDLRGEQQASELALPRARSSFQEATDKLKNLDFAFRRKAREELNDVTSELARLVQTSEALADRVQRTLVKSPVAGTVKRFLVTTIGGVIQPGMNIVEIVPSEEVMLVEAKIRPSDIAYLHSGQLVNIRFTAYDFAVMGGLEGKLVHISPDTIEDEKQNSYYLVRAETDAAFVAPDGVELPIISGMTVSVDILTGKKSIMSYLLKPILKTKQLALRER